MNHDPAPRRPLTNLIPAFPTARIPLSILLALLLATTALGCSTTQPSPTPNLQATLQARIESTRQVETSIEATVEAIKPIAQAVQATLEARAQAEATPIRPPPIVPQIMPTWTPVLKTTTAEQDCDPLLQEHLVDKTTATDAFTMQAVIRQIQASTEICSTDLWNPIVVDPRPQEPGTCLEIINQLDPSRLPTGLLIPDGTAPRPTSGRDPSNNLIAYWSKAHDEKPSDLSDCWIYLSETNTWMTGEDLRAENTTFTRIDYKQGDCLVFAQGRANEDIEPAKVPCDGEWTHRVASLFEATDPGYYPSRNEIRNQALLKCSPHYTILLHPRKPGWQNGDRQVTCLQDSFGLSLTDPDKLDRMVSLTGLSLSDCFNEAPESGHLQYEIVHCSGHWQLRVLETFEATQSPEYPGEHLLYQESIQKCDRRTTFPYYPDQDPWEIGYRTTHCLQENPTGQPGTPEILDRLVDIDLLLQGECFNTYETQTLYLAELTPCSGKWQYKVLLTDEYPPYSSYPGDAAIFRKATNLCGTENTWRSPNQDIWDFGYRAIICLSDGTAHPDSTPSRPDPTTSANAALDQGIALAEAGQLQEALTALQTAQRLFGGTSAITETWLAFVHDSLEDLPTAVKHHSNAIALDDTATYRIARAYAHINLNNCTPAEEDARVVLRRPPETTPGFHSHVEAQWILALCISDDEAALSHAKDAQRGARTHGYSQTDLESIATLVEELEQSVTTSSRLGPPSHQTSDLTTLPNARWLAQSHPGIAKKLAAFPWVADKLSQPEEELVEQLLYLYVDNTTAAPISLLDMPFWYPGHQSFHHARQDSRNG